MSSVDSSELQIRPGLREKPSQNTMKDIIKICLQEQLINQSYDSDVVLEKSRTICELVKSRLKMLEFSRYKYIVHTVIGERRNQGVRMGCRCFWDSESDVQASETFMNDNIFAITTIYAVYLYYTQGSSPEENK